VDQLKVALSHDVDRVQKTHQYLTRSARCIKKGDLEGFWHELESYPQRKKVYWNFTDIIDTEEAMGVRSTFFFLQESYPFCLLKPSEWKLALGRYDLRSERVSKMIKDLDQGGWEIGLHGSYRSYNDQELLQKEKDTLEYILGKPVIGVRQHYLNLSGCTWSYQEAVGFGYDYSLGFRDRIGYKDGKVKPFYPHGSGFCVFPLAIMDSCYVEDVNREKSLSMVISQTIQNEGILVLNWHSNNWHPDEYPSYKKLYVDLIKRLQDRGAVFDTLNGFYRRLASNE